MDDFQRRSRRSAVSRSICLFAVVLSLPAGHIVAEDAGPELKKFQGDWEVVELVENGKVIAADRIREILPSGGRIQVIENAIIFRSPKDRQQHAKVFAIAPTTYPQRYQHWRLGWQKESGHLSIRSGQAGCVYR